MLTDDETQGESVLSPEVRPRFQSDLEQQLEGPSAAEAAAAAAQVAAPKRQRGRPTRGGKWQVCIPFLLADVASHLL